MTFDQYYQTMKEHGIGELFFLYEDNECSIFTGVSGANLIYHLSNGISTEQYNSLDELVQAKQFGGDRLIDIWERIEILEIDGVRPEDYDAASCSFNYVKLIKEYGEVQWRYFLGIRKSFLLQLKYAFIGTIPYLVFSALFPILGWSNLVFFYLSAAMAVIALTIACVVLWKHQLDINYTVTSQKIIVYNGVSNSTRYDNIKKVKLKKSLFFKNCGTVKIYVKKGWSMNYNIQWIAEPEKVYALIVDNLNRNAGS